MTNIQSLAAQLEAETGVNPCYSYCSYTGKPYAAIHMDMLAGLDEDELLTYALTTMRPSPAWSNLTPERVNRLAYSDPRGLLSYLLIRLYAPKDTASANGLRLTVSQRMSANQNKVQCWNACKALIASDLAVNKLLFALIQLDADFNLTDLNPSTIIKKVMDGSAWDKSAGALFNPKRKATPAMPNQYAFMIEGGVELMTQSAIDWHDFLVTKKDTDTREAKLSAEFWARGSSLARMTHGTLFLKVTPPSPTRLKSIAKAAKENEADAMLAGIIGSLAETAASEPTKPQAIRVAAASKILLEIAKAPRVMVGGVRPAAQPKFNLAALRAKQEA